jgi:FtsP/CotA-like multicopper oxidase with cupredoxin domain
MVTRREFLLLSAAAGGAALLPVGPLVGLARGDAPTTPPTTPWQRPLPIPRTASFTTVAGTRVYGITTTRGVAQLLPAPLPPTEIWGYDGIFPGPTIRAESGTPIVAVVRNQLPEPITVHQHGAVVDGDSDGFPVDYVRFGQAKNYVYPNRTAEVSAQMTARTMWYHDHAMDVTGRNVLNGLAAFYLLRDPNDETDNVIADQYDVPLNFQDRTIRPDGTLFYPGPVDVGNQGFLGDVVLVNGVIQPRFTVARTKYRFRLLNGSNGRQYRLALSNGQPFQLIATEGGFLLGDAVPLTSIFIAQAERYEIVVDFTNAPDQVVLQNRLAGSEQPRLRDLIRFDVTGPKVASGSFPSPLRTSPEPLPLEAEATVRRSFRLHRSHGEFEINDKGFDPARIDISPRAGDTEVWTLINSSGGWTHPVHIHLINFLILDRGGKPPGVHERGFKETVQLPKNGRARVIMRWPDVPPVPVLPPGVPAATGPQLPGSFRDRYVTHCHNLEHEDHDMMNQFQVLPRV